VRGWLLDTNVLAELARPNGNDQVVAWADAQPEQTLFISVLNLAEYDKGIANLPDDAPNRGRLEAAVTALELRFRGRVLSLSDAIVRRWGRLSGRVKRTTGQSPPVIDTLLAATAIQNDLHLVTRNVKDFSDSGASVFNPWRDDPSLFRII
jgi:predicted nucleic acid-binding protein